MSKNLQHADRDGSRAAPEPSKLGRVVAGTGELSAKVEAWIAADRNLNAMQKRWQELESALFANAKRMKVDCDKASQGEMSEARAMRSLDSRISIAHSGLEAEAGAIRSMQAATVEDAIAKVELALKVQGSFDWRPHALQLAEDGIAELRTLLATKGGADST